MTLWRPCSASCCWVPHLCWSHGKIIGKRWKFCIFSSQVAMWIINCSPRHVGLIGNNCNVPTTLHRFPSLIKRHCPPCYWWQKGQLLNYQTAATEGKGSEKQKTGNPAQCLQREPLNQPSSCWAPGTLNSKPLAQSICLYFSIYYLTKDA